MLGRPIRSEVSTAGRGHWSESEMELAEDKEQDSSGIVRGLQ